MDHPWPWMDCHGVSVRVVLGCFFKQMRRVSYFFQQVFCNSIQKNPSAIASFVSNLFQRILVRNIDQLLERLL